MWLKKLLALILVLLSVVTPALADTLTIPHSFTSGTAAQSAQVNANFTAIGSWSSTIANDNIKAAAGIVLSKIDKTAEYLGLRSTGTKVLGAGITGDSVARACFTSDGYMQMGPGSASATDIELRRITGPILRVNDVGATANLPLQALSFQASVLGDANAKVQVDTSNGLTMGAGGASARDMALRRKSSSYFQITDLAGTTNKNLEVAQADATTNGDTQPKASMSTSGFDLGVGGSTAPALRLKYEDANTVSIRNGTTDNAYKSLKALNGTLTGTLDVTGTTTLGAATATSMTIGGSSVVTGSLSAGVCGGYLTLESGVAGSTTDQTAKSTLYFTPDYTAPSPGIIDLYNGSSNVRCTFTELSSSVTGLTADKNYDVFIYDSDANNTADAMELLVWTNDSTRATALATQANIGYVKTGATSRRYVGTIRVYDSGGAAIRAIDSKGQRYVWNLFNQKRRVIECHDTTDSWTLNGTLRPFNNSTTYGTGRVGVVFGLASIVDCTAIHYMSYSASAATLSGPGIGVDSTTAVASGAHCMTATTAAAGYFQGQSATYVNELAAGFHYINPLEQSAGLTSTFYGDNGGAQQSGLDGSVWQVLTPIIRTTQPVKLKLKVIQGGKKTRKAA